jgi:hypothetical protein
MRTQCKALRKRTHLHYGSVTEFSRRRYERADIDLDPTVAPDPMWRSLRTLPDRSGQDSLKGGPMVESEWVSDQVRDMAVRSGVTEIGCGRQFQF